MYLGLGERERQIMEALYIRGRATVQDVLDELPNPPSYSAVRTMLGKLEAKGLVRHVVHGPRYVYLPVAPRRKAQTSAVKRILRSLFDNSAEDAVAAVLDASDVSEAELDRLETLIAQHRTRNRKG